LVEYPRYSQVETWEYVVQYPAIRNTRAEFIVKLFIELKEE